MCKIAFYLMNEKGYFVLENFIKMHGDNPIEYIVTNQDNNLQKDYYNEILELANKYAIKIFNKDDDIKEAEDNFSGYKFAIGWRWIIHNEKDLVVFHDSLLPRYRGFAPLVNSLINGEKMIGVTALFASKDYDKGDIIRQKSLEIDYPIKIDQLIKQILPLYNELVEEIYQIIRDNKNILSQKQNEISSTYSMWLDSEDYFVDWSWSAKKIKRFVDAVAYPYDCAKASLNGQIVKFLEVVEYNDVTIENRDRHIGKIIFMDNGCPVIVCKNGLLKLLHIQHEEEKIQLSFRSRFK